MQVSTRNILILLATICLTVSACGGDDSDDANGDNHDHHHADGGHHHHDAGTMSDGDSMSDASVDTARATSTENDAFYIRYTPNPDPIPVSELFSMTVEVYQSDAMETAVEDATLEIDARMPAHGHGMTTDPEVSAGEESGTFLVDGMKFQMEGTTDAPWRITVDITADETTDTAEFWVVTE